MIKFPNPPKLFFCNKCKVYFFTYSKLDKPTHPKCRGHNTRIGTIKELQEINKINNTNFIYCSQPERIRGNKK